MSLKANLFCCANIDPFDLVGPYGHSKTFLRRNENGPDRIPLIKKTNNVTNKCNGPKPKTNGLNNINRTFRDGYH